MPAPKKTPNFAVYAGVGMSLAFELGAGVAVGWWIGAQADSHWGIKPWGMVTGIIVFLAATLAHIVMLLLRLQDGVDDHEGGK